MFTLLLFFPLALLMSASKTQFSLLSSRDSTPLGNMLYAMSVNKFTHIEVKYIEKDFQISPSDHNFSKTICGGRLFVKDSGFWEDFRKMISHCREWGGFVGNRKMIRSVISHIRDDGSQTITGAQPLDFSTLEDLLSETKIIEWILGPADWIFLDNALGSVTIGPAEEPYALHFVPGLQENVISRQESLEKKYSAQLEASNAQHQAATEELEAKVESLIKKCASLSASNAQHHSDIKALEAKVDAAQKGVLDKPTMNAVAYLIDGANRRVEADVALLKKDMAGVKTEVHQLRTRADAQYDNGTALSGAGDGPRLPTYNEVNPSWWDALRQVFCCRRRQYTIH